MTISDNGPSSQSTSPEDSPSAAPSNRATPNRDKPRESVLINAKAESIDEPQPTQTHEPSNNTPSEHKTGSTPVMPLLAIALLVTLINGYVLYTGSIETSALNERINALEADPASKANQAQLNKLEQRLGVIENRPSTTPSVSPDAVNALTKRMESAEAELKAMSAASQTSQADTKRLAQALSELSAASSKSTSVSTQNDSTLLQLSQRLAQLEAILAAPKSQLRAEEEKFEASSNALHDLTRLILAQSLVQSLEQGQINARLIQALSQSGLSQEKTQILLRLTNPATPTLRQVKEVFSKLAPSLTSVSATSNDASLLDKLANSAASLIKITPVEETANQNSASLLARIEADLARGDLSAALLKWKDLPDSARKRSAEWQAEVDLHRQAQALAQDLLNESLERLGRTSK